MKSNPIHSDDGFHIFFINDVTMLIGYECEFMPWFNIVHGYTTFLIVLQEESGDSISS